MERGSKVGNAEALGSLRQALANGRRLLDGDPLAAAEQAEAILDSDPENREALRLSAAALRRLGRGPEAAQAELRSIASFARVPELARAAQAVASGQLGAAERLLRPYLEEAPDDPAAILMLADVATALG